MPKSFAKKIVKKKLYRGSRDRSAYQPLRLGVMVLAGLFTLVVIGKLIFFLGSLNTPLSPDSNQPAKPKISSWQGGDRINIVVKDQGLNLFSYNPAEKSIIILKIPEEAYLNLPLGFGKWPARSIYSLGQSENPQIGTKLLTGTIETSLGITVDDYLIISGSWSQLSLRQALDKIRANPILVVSMMNNSKTDLTPLEFFRLMMVIRSVRVDKLVTLDLAKSDLTSETKLPDGSQVLTFDQIKLDQYLQNNLVDNLLQNETLTVGVFNATGHPVLAEKAARVVTNMGGRVIFVTNSSLKLAQSVVGGKASYTLRRLSGIFAPDCLHKVDCQKIIDRMDSSRAEVNIYLGEDYFRRYNK